MNDGLTYTFDPAKAARNKAMHGVDFAAAMGFDWASALVKEDTRRDYGERRFIAVGRIGGRVHVLVFTPRDGRLRLISLRRANSKEVKRYEEAQAQRPGQPAADR